MADNTKIKIYKTINDGDDFEGMYNMLIEMLDNDSECVILKDVIKTLKEYDSLFTEYINNYLLKN